MSIDLLEDAINEVSDRDAAWWPFLWLRPAKESRLSLGRVSALALLYGLPLGALASFFLVRLPRGDAPASLVLFATLAAFPLFVLFVGSALVAPMWNRRADRLASPRRPPPPEGGIPVPARIRRRDR